jgi:hypothetical protein
MGAGDATITDPRDGSAYCIVKLRDGNWWLAENLRYELPGSFPADRKPNERALATNPGYDSEKYGRLYTWEAAKKSPPPGWHLPSSREWQKMLNAYGGYGRGLGERQPKGEAASNAFICGLIGRPAVTLAESLRQLSILLPGEFHGDEIAANPGESWLGLFVLPVVHS